MKNASITLFLPTIVLIAGCATSPTTTTTAQHDSARLHVPAAFQTPYGWSISAQSLTLTDSDGSILSAQMSAAKQNLNTPHDTASVLIPINSANEYRLAREREPVEFSKTLHWEDDGETTLSLYEGDRFVLNYHYGVIRPPAGVASHRARSSYIHPLVGLDGETFTQDFPADHYHHRGLYFAWPGVHAGGQRYDMWHLIGMWTKFEHLLIKEEGPVFNELIIQNGWYTDTRKVMDEVMNLTVWRSDDIGQFIDIEYIWTPLEPIKIAPKDQKGYGGLNFRFPERENTVVTTSDGVQPTSDLHRSPWADFSAQFDGASDASGITIMNHPDNIDANPPWIIRAADEYGFLGVSWPGGDTFYFVEGKTYTNKYRVFIHRGGCNEAMVKEAFDQFANPPTVKISQ